MIKHLLTRGIGFSPGSVKFIVTGGLEIGVAAVAIPANRYVPKVVQTDNRPTKVVR